MDLDSAVAALYEKDTSETYMALIELEELSDKSDALYPYVSRFAEMIKDKKYAVRVRGFRLFCKQAKWDAGNIVNARIDGALAILQDEKPTAVRQALQYLKFVLLYKPELTGRVKDAALSVDASRFKDTMRPLIEKDVKDLLSPLN